MTWMGTLQWQGPFTFDIFGVKSRRWSRFSLVNFSACHFSTALGLYTQYQYQLKAILEAAENANRIDNTGWLLDNYLFASLSRKLPACCWFSSSELSMKIALSENIQNISRCWFSQSIRGLYLSRFLVYFYVQLFTQSIPFRSLRLTSYNNSLIHTSGNTKMRAYIL